VPIEEEEEVVEYCTLESNNFIISVHKNGKEENQLDTTITVY
jgi:hypothetical protein